MELGITTKIVQVTNIAPTVNIEQLKTFLSFIGRLEQLKLYPERIQLMGGGPPASKVCYAKYARSDDAAVALHLTNTVFIDRALIVAPFDGTIIPDEAEGMRNAHNAHISAFSQANPVEQEGKNLHVEFHGDKIVNTL